MIHEKFSGFYLACSYVIFTYGYDTKALIMGQDELDFLETFLDNDCQNNFIKEVFGKPWNKIYEQF